MQIPKENEAIKLVSSEDRARVSAVLTTAFTSCPLLRWLYPEPDRYLRNFGKFLEYYSGDPYTDRSGAWFNNGDKGALLWLTDEVHRDDARLIKFLLGSVPDFRRAETEDVFDQFGKYHPQKACWYFTMLGIDPIHQRSGLGERLYRYGLGILDEAKGLAFTEATSSESARLYQRLGWEVLGEVQIGSSPSFFPMVRYPK
ncbi:MULTISPECIES: GNAT family N-acetyltransferase [Bradyrhizobium]|uniref:GNAT family N-acetyltransferase n=1 Tax=Bradyrhizobium centrosematis TaxID=1300039 RepID=UPI00216A998A|nr:GNAT family N-acetyltransferase [Bradyrhizobium centrosematis]MCS3765505.1 ribosomal protein S18 acetylase RimI-like enzyme [Bradyrhizobium centrosematis]MCS3778039.1 ribosomal protein S18 acetylase RimI-like enzyme [Bradyrhizobium centrosematis]